MSTLEKRLDVVRQWVGNGTINIFGRPFAGKETQGLRLARDLGTECKGGGEILRDIERQGMMPEHVRRLMNAGGLIETEDFVKLAIPYLATAQFAGKPLVFSAVGRKAGEEHLIKDLTDNSGHPLKAVPYFAITEEEAYRRREREVEMKEAAGESTRGDRADDGLAELENRLKVFRLETVPVLDYYSQAGLLIEFDGTLDRDTLYQEMVFGLHELAQAS